MKEHKSLNRREFVRTAAGLAAGMSIPAIVPASAPGVTSRKPPSDRIVMGCIGLGGQGTYNLQAFLNQPDTQIVALCDVNQGSDDYDMLYQFDGTTAGLVPALERANAYYSRQSKGQYKGCDTYSDFRELLLRDDIDAVTVCTPDHWHGLISIAAAKAGKDVYCEKPLTNTVAEGRAVCDAVSRYRTVLQTGSHERSNHSVRYAAELIRNGYIGKVHTVRVNMPVDSHGPVPPQQLMPVPVGLDYDFWLGPTPWMPYTKKRSHFWWRYQLVYGGGEMTDRGAHILDLAQFILDKDDSGPVMIRGKGWAPENGLFDTFMKFDFECEYDNGVRLYGNSDTPRGIKFEGSEGWIFIHIHGGRLEAEPASLLTRTIAPDEIRYERTTGHHRNFLEAVKTRQKPFAHAEIGHRTGTLCHLINIAMLTDAELHWDPVAEKVTNHVQANTMLKRPMRAPWHL